MKKLTILAASLLISSSVFANTQTIRSDKSFSTEAFADKSAAYEAGFSYLDSLNDLSDSKLKHKLSVTSQSTANNFKIDKSKVSVEEFATNRGEVSYRALINVDYHFTAIDSRN